MTRRYEREIGELRRDGLLLYYVVIDRMYVVCSDRNKLVVIIDDAVARGEEIGGGSNAP